MGGGVAVCTLPVCPPPCAPFQFCVAFMYMVCNSKWWREILVYIYIYIEGTEREGLNFASFLVQFSSFWKKKESLKKKRNRSSFVPFLWIVPECLMWRHLLHYPLTKKSGFTQELFCTKVKPLLPRRVHYVSAFLMTRKQKRNILALRVNMIFSLLMARFELAALGFETARFGHLSHHSWPFDIAHMLPKLCWWYTWHRIF